MSVWFKSRLNPWYIWIPSNPNLYSTKIIMKMRWQTIASNVSIRTISPTATPLPKAYDCVAVYIAGRRTHLVVKWLAAEATNQKKVPWNGAVNMRSHAGSWETWSICRTLRHNWGTPADMHANVLGILIIYWFPLA